MDQSRILLKLALDEIGLGELKLDTFKDRLCIQKKVYLVQTAGLDLGYRYNWYLKGPYCPKLTEDVYLLKGELEKEENEYKEYELNEKAKECIKKAKKILDLPPDTQIDEAEWVELLASLHYLKMIAYWSEEPSKKSVIEKLLNVKSQFRGNQELIEKAWSRLENFKLLNKKSLAN
jgi:uncharacterized protein YwgA